MLLDEYQDTSVAQALMLSRLFSGPDAGTGRGHPVTAVGDPNQAIYGWRGASVSNILDFAETSRPPTATPCRRYPLTVNRRSDARILEVANRLAAPLYDATSRAGRRWSAKPDAGGRARSRATVLETHDEELAWLRRPGRAHAHAATAEPCWSRDRRAHPRQRARRRRSSTR